MPVVCHTLGPVGLAYGVKLRLQKQSAIEEDVMRDKIRLISTAGTGYEYYTTKNKRTMPEKMRIKKYDPRAKKHVDFTEGKISKG